MNISYNHSTKQVKERGSFIMNNHVLLTNGTIIHVENGQVSKGSIEIKDGIITQMYEEREVLPSDVEHMDLQGKVIIPGLIDMHCHIQETYAPYFVAAGVTTIRNTAGDTEALSPLIEAPLDAPTPMVYASDALIDGEPGLWGESQPGNFVTDDPEKAREEVRRQAKVGAKFIKVYGLIQEDVLRAITEEARAHNLEVSCDLHHSKEIDALTAAQLGVTWFEHGAGFPQGIYPKWHVHVDPKEWTHIDWRSPNKEKIKEFCMKMIAYNVKICPTFVVYDQAEKLPHYWDPNNIISQSSAPLFEGHWTGLMKHHDAVYEQTGFLNRFIQVLAKIYADLGGIVVAGSDTPALPGIFPGMSLHRELELFVEAGFTPLQALQAATNRAAASIELNHIGLIEKGYIANLLILEKNPLENIRHTQDIAFIVKGGRLYRQKDIIAQMV